PGDLLGVRSRREVKGPDPFHFEVTERAFRSSRPAIGRVAEGAEQQWDVVMVFGLDFERYGYAWVEAVGVGFCEIGRDVEREAIDSLSELVWEIATATVTVGSPAAERSPASAFFELLELSRNVRGRLASAEIENVRR